MWKESAIVKILCYVWWWWCDCKPGVPLCPYEFTSLHVPDTIHFEASLLPDATIVFLLLLAGYLTHIINSPLSCEGIITVHILKGRQIGIEHPTHILLNGATGIISLLAHTPWCVCQCVCVCVCMCQCTHGGTHTMGTLAHTHWHAHHGYTGTHTTGTLAHTPGVHWHTHHGYTGTHTTGTLAHTPRVHWHTHQGYTGTHTMGTLAHTHTHTLAHTP